MRLALVTMLLALSIAASTRAANVPFRFDRASAVAQAIELTRSQMQKYPGAAIPGVDYEHPEVAAVIAASARHLIVVTFSSALARWGAYVIFEQCRKSGALVANGAGKVIDIDVFREVFAKIGLETPLALPKVC